MPRFNFVGYVVALNDAQTQYDKKYVTGFDRSGRPLLGVLSEAKTYDDCAHARMIQSKASERVMGDNVHSDMYPFKVAKVNYIKRDSEGIPMYDRAN